MSRDSPAAETVERVPSRLTSGFAVPKVPHVHLDHWTDARGSAMTAILRTILDVVLNYRDSAHSVTIADMSSVSDAAFRGSHKMRTNLTR